MFNARQVAAHLGLSEPTVLRRLADGSIPAARLGRRWVVDPFALDELIRDRRPKVAYSGGVPAGLTVKRARPQADAAEVA